MHSCRLIISFLSSQNVALLKVFFLMMCNQVGCEETVIQSVHEHGLKCGLSPLDFHTGPLIFPFPL